MTRTTIEIDSQTRDRLKRAGRMDETYDVFLNRMLDERENNKEKKTP
jgi:hypothetical protein